MPIYLQLVGETAPIRIHLALAWFLGDRSSKCFLISHCSDGRPTKGLICYLEKEPKKKKALLPGFHGSDFTQNHPSNPINPNFPDLAIRSLCAESKAGVGLENTFTGRQIRGQMSRAANRRASKMSQLLPAAASAYCVVFVFSQNKHTDPKTLNFKLLGQKKALKGSK